MADETAAIHEHGHFLFGLLIDGRVDEERIERDGVMPCRYLSSEVRQCRNQRRGLVERFFALAAQENGGH